MDPCDNEIYQGISIHCTVWYSELLIYVRTCIVFVLHSWYMTGFPYGLDSVVELISAHLCLYYYSLVHRS